MKLTKVTLCLATLALGIASAASSYTITLLSDTKVGDAQLKPGQYKLTVEGNQATFTQGKNSTQVPVTVEQNAKKFSNTAVETIDSKVNAIDLGGTKTKLVISPAKTSATAQAGGQ